MATTQKCPHCGAGWAGRKVSAGHMAACARKNKAAFRPTEGAVSTSLEGAAGSAAPATPSVDSVWQRFRTQTDAVVSKTKEQMKPGLLGGKRRGVAVAAVALASVSVLSACASDADVASENLSTAAEQFEIERRVVFFNGITDKYLLEINGRCSVESAESALGGALEVTCKTGPNEYKKHYLGLSDNVSYFVEQVEGADVSVYNYRVIYKPDVIVPDIELNTQVGSTP